MRNSLIEYLCQVGPDRACPITEPNIFACNFDKFSPSNTSKAFIFQVLMKRQNVFNSIDASHASKILHLALEHPAQKALVVFGSKERKTA